MFTSGDRASWLNAVAAKIMDGVTPPSMSYLLISVPPMIVTRENDGHVTAAAALGENHRKDYEAGWRIIIEEMITLLREQGFVGGNDQALTWIKSVDGTWRVEMPEGNRQLTVFGQRERRMSRDRSVVGERNEDDGSPVGPPSSFEAGRMRPFELDVVRPRGGVVMQKFELHPFALAIPSMTEAEREALRTSIERDGVKVPIVIYEKKILDGRNRAYFASVFHKPVRIEEFVGTEDEARRHVANLNLNRRHLVPAQRHLAVFNLFGDKAAKEAHEAIDKGRDRSHETRRLGPLKTAEPNEPSRDGEWHNRVVAMAKEAGITGVTPMGMRNIKEVIGAPATIARIENGEIYSVAEANAEARKEKQLPASIRSEGMTSFSANTRVGKIIEQCKAIIEDDEMNAGNALPAELSERFRLAKTLLSQAEQSARNRKWIR